MKKKERRVIPEAFHPGEYLKDELEAREWSVAEFALKIGQSMRLKYEPILSHYSIVVDLRQIIVGRSAISSEMAERIGKALGTGAEVWLNLQTVYDLTKEIRSARKKK